VVVVLFALAVHPKLRLLLVIREYNKDKLVLIVIIAIVTKHYNARIANLYL
jgi:hypothetical protein